MPTPTLRQSILGILAKSSSQMPVDLTVLKSALLPRIKLAELTGALDAMCISRELQTCNGERNGEAYVCYWVSGNLPPAWRSPQKGSAAKPEAKRKA
jgi:hypothetical protein